MKKKNLVGVVLAGLLLMGGCGRHGNSASYSTKEAMTYEAPAAASNSYYAEESYYDMDMADMESYGMGDSEAMAPEVSESSETAKQSSRKLIRTVNLEVETKTFDDLLVILNQRTKSLGGYIESSYSYNGSDYQGRKGVRNASLTIRIPADQLDAFLNEVSDVANVVSKNENVSDVTLTYVDMESHRNALRTEEESLIKMMEQAESVEDLITIESRLSDVRYQLESMESQLRTYDNLVDYATLTISVSEVEELTPVVEQTALERMGSGFVTSLKNIGRGLQDFGINLVIDLPYLILWGVILFVAFLIVRGIIRGIIKKARAKKAGVTKTAEGAKETKSSDTEAPKDADKKKE